MSLLSDLCAAALRDLDADGPRLVYADALQAAGDARGELIAIQCELARLGCDRTRVALWTSPEAGRRSLDATRRVDWIGDALASAEPEKVAKLRLREKKLLSLHEAPWAGSLPGYRFGRGFVDHVFAGRGPELLSIFETAPYLRSLELAFAEAETLRSPLLEQCRQLRLTLGYPIETDVLLDRLDRLELPFLRELAVRGMSNTAGSVADRTEPRAVAAALDRFAASPGLARLEALDLDDQAFDVPERIEQILQAAPLRDLRLGSNGLNQPAIYRVLARCAAAARLEILDLFYAGTDSALAPLVSSPHLQGLRALRIVTGSQVRCFEDGARAIGDAFPELRVLDLRYTPFNRFLQDLVGGGGLRALTHLGLRGDNLDDTQVRQLADSPLFGRLRVLDLRDNAITDGGAKALAARGPGRLEVLELQRNVLTAKGRDLLHARFPGARIEIGKPK